MQGFSTATELPAEVFPDGQPVRQFQLSSGGGLMARVSGYGARIMALHVPLADGELRDIVVGHDRAADNIGGDRCAGAICGRFAGRIAASRFAIDGRQTMLAANEGPNHLHGGADGFDRQVWAAEPVDGGIRFVHISAAGHEHYPGRLVATATYRFVDPLTLECALLAATDQLTVVNLTNHVYWNLAGHAARSLADHQLQIAADSYVPVDAALLPTGRFEPVAGTPLDYRHAHPIDDVLAVLPKGVDHNFVLRHPRGTLRRAATLTHRPSGIAMDVSTSEPGLQVYTGWHLGPGVTGKAGVPLQRFGALALEPQNFPDAPNRREFPTAVLRPGELYRHIIQWRFGRLD